MIWVRVLVGFGLLLFLLAVGCVRPGAYGVNTTPDGNATLRIGVVLPLTGDVADQGLASQKGILLAVERANAEGGVNGKPVELIFEDSACDATKAVTAFQKLTDVDHVQAAIGDICDSATAAMIPLADRKKVVLITPGSTSPDISGASPYVFRFWFSEEQLGRMAAEDAYRRGLHRMAILYINSAWGVAQNSVLTREFTKLGGEVVASEPLEFSSQDFRTEVTKAKAKQPDGYYVVHYVPALLKLLQQMREFEIREPIYSHGGVVGSILNLGQEIDLVEGVHAPTILPAVPDFEIAFRARFGAGPGVTADSAYDALYALVSAARAKGVQPDQLRAGIVNLQNIAGASGTYSVNSRGDTSRPLVMRVVRGGAFQES